jgi:hypothetical protein
MTPREGRGKRIVHLNPDESIDRGKLTPVKDMCV